MRPSDLDLLRCPACSGELALSARRVDNGNVVSGLLRCPGCGRDYPIIDHVCVFLSEAERDILLSDEEKRLIRELRADAGAVAGAGDDPDRRQMRVGINWEYQFSGAFPVGRDILDNPDGFWGERAFYRFCGLDKADLDGRVVAVFCGGSGREAWHLRRTGAKRIVALDLGGHIGRLPRLLADSLDRLLLIRCDALRHPLRQGSCDVAICDHALQHIPDHAGAYRAMSEAVADGGLFSICVYSHENNWPMTRVVEPAKRVLHLFPIRVLRYAALAPAGLIWLYHAVACGGLGRVAPRLAARLPWNDLFALWRRDGFKKIWEACFDLIHAPVSHHFRQAETAGLALNNGLEIRRLELVNATMWTMVARKPAARA